MANFAKVGQNMNRRQALRRNSESGWGIGRLSTSARRLAASTTTTANEIISAFVYIVDDAGKATRRRQNTQ